MDAASLVRGTPPGTIVHLLPEWCTPAEEAYLTPRPLREGDAVHADWKRKGTAYPAWVRAARGDGTFDVECSRGAELVLCAPRKDAPPF